MNSLVSVILPVFNGEVELDRAVASVVAQSHRNLEILIVDDGSTDATPRLIERWRARDSRIRSFRQSQSGVAAARNRAIAEAQGEFVAPLDHDDIWSGDKIASQLALFQGAGDRLALVSSGWARIDAQDRILSQTAAPTGNHDRLKRLAQRNYIASSSIPLMRRSAVLESGGYCESLRAANAQGCEDYLLYLRIAERYELAHVPRVLVGYRTSGNTMSQDLDRMIRSYRMVADELSARHPALRREFQPGLVRLQRHMSTRALRRGDWGQGLAIAVRIATRHPYAALSSYAAAATHLVQRYWRGQQRTAAAADAPLFVNPSENQEVVAEMASDGGEAAGVGR